MRQVFGGASFRLAQYLEINAFINYADQSVIFRGWTIPSGHQPKHSFIKGWRELHFLIPGPFIFFITLWILIFLLVVIEVILTHVLGDILVFDDSVVDVAWVVLRSRTDAKDNICTFIINIRPFWICISVIDVAGLFYFIAKPFSITVFDFFFGLYYWRQLILSRTW